ncbi:Heat shock protein SSE1 [Tritrichomonas foetus]|uniref:Heat shock protein SSE1 n=1 Tax=Tritrichomonas foetus TaxID=1144522 RepID=A0A1J4L1Q2_9EUKA|nr:Heat shock protein SSE1 [Tritrichomonas foetus]|eukprot:OHT15821.1 Heat shock protein SSE1 [Tritrichomonas foetus]
MNFASGVDFGNMNCVIAVPAANGIDIVLNQSSNRLTPTMVTFAGDRRYSGELASQHQMQFVQGTITELKRLIMLNFESDERKTIEKSVPFKLLPLQDGTTGIEVQIRNENLVFRPEQCIACLLKDIQKVAENHNQNVNRYVFAVSPWWTEKHRRSFLSAVKIAGIECLSLVNSTTAAAIAYSMIHRNRLPPPDKDSVNVAFIDFGNSSMNVAIASLKQGLVEIKSFADDNHLGGSYFSTPLREYLIEKVKNKYRINPEDSLRAMLRFNQAVEKVKKTLSINPIVQFEVPSILDVDVAFPVYRDEFDKIITDLIQRIEEPINKALELANVKKEELFEIQVLGGSSRIASVYSELTRIFGREPMKSLNLDECFAIGAGYMAAILSPNMLVPLVVKDISSQAVKATWKNENSDKNGEIEVFKQFTHVPYHRFIKIPVKESLDLTLWNQEEEIAFVKIETGIKEEVIVNLNIKLTQSGTVCVSEGLFDYKDKQHEAKINASYIGDFDDKQMKEFQEIENELSQMDEIENQIDVVKNDLEGFIFSVSNDMNRDLKEYINPENLNNVESVLSNVQLWFEENEFERMSLDEYQEKLNELKQCFDPIYDQKSKYHELSEASISLKESLCETLAKFREDVYHSECPGYSLLKSDLESYIQSIKSFFDQPKYINFEVNLDEERNKVDILAKRVEEMRKSDVTPTVQEELTSSKQEKSSQSDNNIKKVFVTDDDPNEAFNKSSTW